MTKMGNTEAMAKTNCMKEKCRFYDAICEATYDGCMFGASIQDTENEKACVRRAFYELADKLEKECGDWQSIPDTEANKKFRERVMAEVRKREEKQYGTGNGHNSV